ncbi:MAG: 3-isopropylmalate dehydratase [Theionarchaea archaeon]|nr:3-isopropylmalate dehydratase [Theionarchaea archaeon]MBU7001119.1 3-isopropylmalate dehydratase [Theionarchaea archaeon]MBU7034257.1 3-isopropylmalate dehydratase [Theionarchaea archaeon]MBU7039331.1 3-isopropylmalate dehydratase [Theionarchaea archaeon]
MKMKGRVFKYGDDVNTDVIFPGKYTYTISDPKEMAKHALEDLDPAFIQKVKKGDILVAGKYFGCGSSREQAVTCLKEAGISVVIAESFARIYYRNCINSGLPPLILEDTSHINAEDELEVDVETGTVTDVTTGAQYTVTPLPPFIMQIIQDGGLIPHLKKEISHGR